MLPAHLLTVSSARTALMRFARYGRSSGLITYLCCHVSLARRLPLFSDHGGRRYLPRRKQETFGSSWPAQDWTRQTSPTASALFPRMAAVNSIRCLSKNAFEVAESA